MEELKNLMKDAFYSAVRMNAFYNLGGSEEEFNEYWDKESTQKAVKNIAVLDGVSGCNCQQDLKKVSEIIDFLNEEE